MAQTFTGGSGLSSFNDALVDTLVEQRVAPLDSAPFSASLLASEVGELALVDASVSALTSHRRTTADDADGSVFLLFPWMADGVIRHRGGEEEIAPGRVIVVPGGESFDVVYPTPAAVTFVVVPGDQVERRFPALAGRIRSGSLTPAAASVSATLPMVGAAARAAEGAVLGRSLAAMLSAVVDVVADDGLADAATTVRMAAERMIDADFADRRLGAPWLAARLGVSVRSLHRAFAGGPSVLDTVQRRRLAAAADALATTPLRVSDVAGSAGFGSPSQFAALFRESYGVTPTEWRERRESEGGAARSR